MHLRSDDVSFLVYGLGWSLTTYVWFVLSISLLNLFLSFRPSIPARRFLSYVCTKVTSLCGIVSYTTGGFTSWVYRSGFPVFLIVCFDCIGIVKDFIIGVRACLTTLFVVVFAGKIRVALGLVFFSFELTALVSIVTRFFAVVASWFGSFWVLLCGLLRHCIYLQLFLSFQTIQLQLLLKLWHNVFTCTVLQMRLVNRFLQVGRHFGIYELLNDRLSGNSECIFRKFLEFV